MTIANARMRRGRILLIASLATACATIGIMATPALATNEYYECGNCFTTNGAENWVKNNFAINHSGEGVCGVVWRNNGGGNYTNMITECVAGGGTAKACAKSEVWGHGEATSENGSGFLRGRQDNFSACE